MFFCMSVILIPHLNVTFFSLRAASHANLLSQKRDHLLKALKPTKDCDISTIAYIKSKTVLQQPMLHTLLIDVFLDK